MTMLDTPVLSANLAVAYTAYLIGVASPGPSNFAIMGTAMAHGRRHAMALAAGVISGSLLWGVFAAFGLASLMRSYSAGLVIMKVVGGLYLLWLSWKAANAARSSETAANAGSSSAPLKGWRHSYIRGAALHLTNPKAIFVWLSIVSLALPAGARATDALTVVAGCGVIGSIVFVTYAVAFSTPAVRRRYWAFHRWLNVSLSLVFAYAGIRMLASAYRR